MICSNDLREALQDAIAKAGVQQYNAIVYLTKAETHKKFKALDRLLRYSKHLDQKTITNIFNGL